MAMSMKVTSSGMLRHVVWYKLTDVSKVLTAFIIRVIAWHNIPEDSHLYTHQVFILVILLVSN
jgi:hypothetical protein